MSASPAASGIRARQPSAVSAPTSKILRGVPSGRAKVEGDGPSEANCLGHHRGEVGDGDITAAADIDGRRRVIMVQQKRTGVGEVVDMQELAARPAAAPYRHTCRADQSGGVETAHQGRRHMAVLGVKIVPRAK